MKGYSEPEKGSDVENLIVTQVDKRITTVATRRKETDLFAR
jgi:hypothetical protein